MSLFFNDPPEDFNQRVEVSTIFFDWDNKLLLLQRSLISEIAPGKWGVPGGKLEKNETPLKGLKREIQEELSLDYDEEKIIYLKSFYVRNKILDYKLHLFQGSFFECPTIILNPSEHADFIWYPKSKVMDLPLLEGQLEALKLSHFI